jgi:hypothetical protein
MATHSEGRGLILVSDTHKLMTTPILVILFLELTYQLFSKVEILAISVVLTLPKNSMCVNSEMKCIVNSQV